MDAEELFRVVDGEPKQAGVWFCSACRTVRSTRREADECCQPWFCSCGQQVDRFYKECNACKDKRLAAKELARFESAQKSTDDKGPFFRDGLGQEFFQDIESLEDHLEFEEDRPLYVWCCTTERVVTISVDDILDGIADDAYEGFDPDDLDGIEDLRAAVAQFNDLNRDVVRWVPDFTRARLIDPTPEA